jgi:hypothetical protein
MHKLLDIRKGTKLLTPHGLGTLEHFEVYPPLYAVKSGTRDKFDGPDIVDEFPHNAEDGSFIRIGVSGCHQYLEVAYYTVNELKPA